MDKIENNANLILFLGAVLLAFFHKFLNYLGIQAVQVYTLLFVFSLSGIAGLIKTLALNEKLKAYIIGDLLAKTLIIFIPFMIAIISKSIPFLYALVDYSFGVLVIGEFFSFLISIQSIKNKKSIQEIDFYNLFIEKFKNIALKFLKLNQNTNEKDYK